MVRRMRKCQQLKLLLNRPSAFIINKWWLVEDEWIQSMPLADTTIHVFSPYVRRCDHSLKLQPWTANHHRVFLQERANTCLRNDHFVHVASGLCRGSCCPSAGKGYAEPAVLAEHRSCPPCVALWWGEGTASFPTSSALLRQVHRRSITNLLVTKFVFHFAAQEMCPVEEKKREEKAFLVY